MGCFSSRPMETKAPAAPVAPPAPAAAPAAPVEVASAPVRRPAPVTELNRATLTLKSNRDRVQQGLAAAERQCDADLASAVALKREGKLDRAVLVMKRRRLVQQRVEDAHKRLMNLESMLGAVETQENAGFMLEAVQESNTALRNFSKVCNPDTIAAAHADWTERVEDTERVQAVLDEARDDGFVMPSDDEINAEIAAYYAGRGDVVEETAPGGEEKVLQTVVPSVLTTQDVVEKVNAAEATPDVMPEMPTVEEEVVETPAKKQRQVALA